MPFTSLGVKMFLRDYQTVRTRIYYHNLRLSMI